jgi:hypothetical protein
MPNTRRFQRLIAAGHVDWSMVAKVSHAANSEARRALASGGDPRPDAFLNRCRPDPLPRPGVCVEHNADGSMTVTFEPHVRRVVVSASFKL